MNPQKVARLTGILFIITFIPAIVAAFFSYVPVLDDARYIVGGGADMRVLWGALFEMIVVVANIGTAVVLYPIIKRQHEGVAIGYVASRVVESVVIMVGIFSLVSIVTLRQDFAGATGAEAESLVIMGKSLVAFHDWTFLFGPGLLAGVGNGMLLGYLLYRSGLVPRWMARLGLIGGPVLALGFVGVLFDVFEAGSVWQGIATAPEFVYELSLGIYLIVKGFKQSPITSLDTPVPTIEPSAAAA